MHSIRWLCTATSVFWRGNIMSPDNQNYLRTSSGLFTFKIYKIRQLTANFRLKVKNKQRKTALQNVRLFVIVKDSGLYYCYHTLQSFWKYWKDKKKTVVLFPYRNTEEKLLIKSLVNLKRPAHVHFFESCESKWRNLLILT